MDAERRKREINLITVGTGVALFGIWSLIRISLTFVLFGARFDTSVPDELVLAFNIVIWSLVGVDCLLRCYIGLSARAEGMGKRRRVTYLVWTGFLLTLYALIIQGELALLFNGGTEDYLSLIISILIDGTSTVFLLELMINSIGLRRIKKQEGARA